MDPNEFRGPYNPNPPKPKKQAPVIHFDQELLQGVDKIIAVASGKGGVGKSTVAVNLAITMARLGYKVGLADADVYGPSVPKMTGTEGTMPRVEVYDAEGTPWPEDREIEPTCKEVFVPVVKYGVKWMSIGYFAAPEQALIWRGPMASTALKQIVLQTAWGKLDYLFIDMPPGTGDIHISLVNDIPLTGAIIVSTPQAVALADVEKGVNMFRNPQIDKHIFGILENMSWFTPEELPDNRYYIFGHDGCAEMCRKYNLPLLGQIPLVQGIREGGDEGTPAALHDGPIFDALKGVAKML